MSTNGANGSSGTHSTNGGGKAPVDRALELFLYGPVGFTVMAAQAMPKLVGELVSRSCAQLGEVETKIRQARMIGEVAVNYGPKLVRREVDQRLADAWRRAGGLASFLPGGGGDGSEASPAGPPTGATATVPPPAMPTAAKTAPAKTAPAKTAPAKTAPAKTARARTTPAAADLPIPAYDGLSASQVVSRLSGLSTDELAAVRAYETAGRGRKTVLVAIDRLLP